MKIFVCEFITGGGLARDPLPPGLTREGGMMAAALVADLSELPRVRVIASRDVRLPPLPDVDTIAAGPDEDLSTVYARGVSRADAAWPIAPETGGSLERLARATIGADRRLLGCRPDAIRTAASKRMTAATLRSRGIPVVPTFTAADVLPPFPGRWVVKPDDGAGCEDTRVVPEQSVARCLLAADPQRLVAQPWIEGEPASLSLVCAGDRCLLLACNRQAVRITGDRVIVDRLCVNGLSDPGGRLAALARNVVSAIPGLWGYIGIDLILTREGPVVLEVNPRLTTSYCGLRGALGMNVAAMVLGLAGMTGPAPWRRPASGRPVEIALAGHL